MALFLLTCTTTVLAAMLFAGGFALYIVLDVFMARDAAFTWAGIVWTLAGAGGVSIYALAGGRVRRDAVPQPRKNAETSSQQLLDLIANLRPYLDPGATYRVPEPTRVELGLRGGARMKLYDDGGWKTYVTVGDDEVQLTGESSERVTALREWLDDGERARRGTPPSLLASSSLARMWLALAGPLSVVAVTVIGVMLWVAQLISEGGITPLSIILFYVASGPVAMLIMFPSGLALLRPSPVCRSPALVPRHADAPTSPPT